MSKIRYVLASVAIVLSACSGGSGPGPTASATACIPSDPATAGQCGTLVVALTDVEGDFASYTVDVLSISLERANGTRIEMLPRTARVDFAQLTSLSELISTATVVPGEFVGGNIRIDYSDAEIFVESASDLVPANVYDSTGTLLTAATPDSVVDMEIRLPDRERLFVTRGRTAMLSIDFDLAASHIVDTSTDPVTVIAEPYLVAEVEPIDAKELRVRGVLLSVDTEAKSYDIRLRPWLHREGDYGVFTVITNDQTEFEIDGVQHTGAAGLEALAGQPAGTLTVAFGTLNRSSRSFTADVVHAGDSIGGDRFTGVLGNIVARTGDQLTLKGAVVIRRDRRAHFHRTVRVDVGPDTAVSRVGDPLGNYDKDDLSVGQRTMILGDLADPAGTDLPLMLDATAGRARMLVTRLNGTVKRLLPGQLDIELYAIDRMSVGQFDFSGTGIAGDVDADPGNYEIATTTLALDLSDTLEPGRPVRILGFVAPFGEAPPDFDGHAVIGPRDLPAVVGIGWGFGGTSAPFTMISPDRLVIDLENPDIGTRHHMLIGDRLIDLYDLPASPALIQSAPPRLYGIHEPGHIELFKDFADFVDELTARLSESDRARSLSAYGSYDDADNELGARRIVVQMLPAPAP